MPTIWFFIVLAETDIVTCVSTATGVGMFGIGGATGVGHAVYAGYHGNPGTLIVVVYVSHAVPITFAIVAVYFASAGDFFGPAPRMIGVHGNPTTIPTDAVGPAITTPVSTAAVCHVPHA
jgi:hypothetical protein